MGSYIITLEVQLSDNVTPPQIQSLIEERLGRDNVPFTLVKVRSVDGEFPMDRDAFTEWRYCLGRYSEDRDRIIELRKSREHGRESCHRPG